ncbi:MAG: PDZ domain-containing protein [Chloroflexota bacterium]
MMVAQPKLGVVLDEEMVVVDVDMGGPADRIGVQRGDRLLSLNEIPFLDNIDSVKDAIRATRHDEEQKSMRLIVERDGKEIAVEVEPNSHYIQKTPFESPLPTMTPLFLDKSRGAYYL